MNPLTNTRNIKALNENDIKNGIFDHRHTWHSQYKDSAYIFVGGLPYDLTEGDILCVFSQPGEIVNINLVRDKKTGKSQGYCFICYEDQRSTILAVDNLNSIKLGGRTIRVDHVSNYRAPKSDEKDEEGNYKLKEEKGCAPEMPAPEAKKKKKKKKEKKKKKKKKIKEGSSSESSDTDEASEAAHRVGELASKQVKKEKSASQWDKRADGRSSLNGDEDASSSFKKESSSRSTENEESKTFQGLGKMKKEESKTFQGLGKMKYKKVKEPRDPSPPPRKRNRTHSESESKSDDTNDGDDDKVSLGLPKMKYNQITKKEHASQRDLSSNTNPSSRNAAERNVSPHARRSRSSSGDNSPPRKRNKSPSKNRDYR